MKKFIMLAVALAFIAFAGNITLAKQANACDKGISCKQPVGGGAGFVREHTVLYCVIGNPGNFTKVDCKSSIALHMTPTGNMGVCFIGSDGKPHWEYQREVRKGRHFINWKKDGRWQIGWPM